MKKLLSVLLLLALIAFIPALAEGYADTNCNSVLRAGDVYASPSLSAAKVGQVGYLELVRVLYFDGDFAYITFRRGSDETHVNGFFPWRNLEYVYGAAGYMLASTPVYSDLSARSGKTGKVAGNEIVCIIYSDDEDFYYINYYNASERSIEGGYVPAELVYEFPNV